MSDQPVTLAVLAKFHREVILPDMQRIVEECDSRAEDPSALRLAAGRGPD